MSKSHIGEIFRRARLGQNLIGRDVSGKTGDKISPAAISKIELGQAEPMVSTAWMLAKALGLSLDAVMAEVDGVEGQDASLRAVYSVPILPWSRVEALAAPPERWPDTGSTASFPTIEHFGPGTFSFIVESNAMQAAQGFCYPEGAIVIADPAAQARSGSAVVARIPATGEVFFRQLLKDGSRNYLRALNNTMPTIDAGPDLVILATVVGMWWRPAIL